MRSRRPEIDRLAIAAPAQARALLETEGYFDAEVKVEQSPGAGDLPHIKLTVVPGPRVRVKSVRARLDRAAGAAHGDP